MVVGIDYNGWDGDLNLKRGEGRVGKEGLEKLVMIDNISFSPPDLCQYSYSITPQIPPSLIIPSPLPPL